MLIWGAGASLTGDQEGWFTGPDWLDEVSEWPDQPMLRKTPQIEEEEKPQRELAGHVTEIQRDEWDDLLARRSYWSTIRIVAWALRYADNSLAKRKVQKKRSGPLTTVEMITARNHLVRRSQKYIPEDLSEPQFKLTKDLDTGILRCEGRIANYKPIYISNLCNAINCG